VIAGADLSGRGNLGAKPTVGIAELVPSVSGTISFPLHEIASALACLAMTPPLFVIASPDKSGRGNLR